MYRDSWAFLEYHPTGGNKITFNFPVIYGSRYTVLKLHLLFIEIFFILHICMFEIMEKWYRRGYEALFRNMIILLFLVYVKGFRFRLLLFLFALHNAKSVPSFKLLDGFGFYKKIALKLFWRINTKTFCLCVQNRGKSERNWRKLWKLFKFEPEAFIKFYLFL